jgi:signal transduction histidine kinase
LIIEETGTTLKVDELPKIQAVPGQLKQLFSNIISNAIKFRKTDVPPQIEIVSARLTPEETEQYKLPSDKKYYKIDITDNGIGFEDEYAEQIFKIFQRLHGKSEYPGSGIGLAICKKIVDYHQGRIFAVNIAGRGARFSIILPGNTDKTDIQ